MAQQPLDTLPAIVDDPAIGVSFEERQIRQKRKSNLQLFGCLFVFSLVLLAIGIPLQVQCNQMGFTDVRCNTTEWKLRTVPYTYQVQAIASYETLRRPGGNCLFQDQELFLCNDPRCVEAMKSLFFQPEYAWPCYYRDPVPQEADCASISPPAYLNTDSLPNIQKSAACFYGTPLIIGGGVFSGVTLLLFLIAFYDRR